MKNNNNNGVKRGYSSLKRDYIIGIIMLIIMALAMGAVAFYCLGLSIKLFVGIASCFGSCAAIRDLIKIWSE